MKNWSEKNTVSGSITRVTEEDVVESIRAAGFDPDLIEREWTEEEPLTTPEREFWQD